MCAVDGVQTKNSKVYLKEDIIEDVIMQKFEF